MLAVNSGVAEVLELEVDTFSKNAGGRAFGGIGFVTLAVGCGSGKFVLRFCGLCKSGTKVFVSLRFGETDAVFASVAGGCWTFTFG